MLAHPWRVRTGIRMYERLVVGKHRLHHMHYSISRVQKLFMERWKARSWDGNDVRDNREFFEVEKEIYLEMFPQSAKLFKEEVEEEEDQSEEENGSSDEVEVVEVRKKKKKRKIVGKKEEV